AKDALEACDGSVVDAIIAIEEKMDEKEPGSMGEYVRTTVGKVKELVNKGNITKISVKKDDESIVNIPVTVGLVGAVLAPWGLLAAAIAAFGFKCKVELTAEDGKVIDISEKVTKASDQVKEKAGVVVDELKNKAPEVYDKVKDAGQDTFGNLKEKAPEYFDKAKAAGQEAFGSLKDKAPEYFDKAKAAGQEAFENLKEKAPEYFDKAKAAGQEAFENLKDKVAGEDDFEVEIEVDEQEVNDELNK
ncbi:MAG: DUF4342 domain-containing protein, partial [Firmicutes bacterium]|nr:DUF4342 domain-containing protein [Bacillota bacterium]